MRARAQRPEGCRFRHKTPLGGWGGGVAEAVGAAPAQATGPINPLPTSPCQGEERRRRGRRCLYVILPTFSFSRDQRAIVCQSPIARTIQSSSQGMKRSSAASGGSL